MADDLHPDADIHQRLRWARKRSNLSQREIAEHFHIAPASVAQWEAAKGRKTEPDREKLIPLSQLLKVNPLWLAFGLGLPDQPSEFSLLINNDRNTRYLPVIDHTQVMGVALGAEAISTRLYPARSDVGPRAFAILIHDGSMEPMMPRGRTQVAFDPDRAADPGDIVIARVDKNEPIVGFLVSAAVEGNDNPAWYVRPSNPDHAKRRIKDKSAVIGVAAEYTVTITP